MSELFEVGADGEVTVVQLLRSFLFRHTSLLRCSTRSAAGEKGGSQEPVSFFQNPQVDSVLSADGRRPVRRRQYSAPVVPDAPRTNASGVLATLAGGPFDF